MGGQVSYYRDRYGLKSDCVLTLKNEDYALIEIKLGSKKIENRAKNLLKLDKIIKKKLLKKLTCILRNRNSWL